MKCGQEIEILQPEGPLFRQVLTEMMDEDGTLIDTAPHAQQLVRIRMQQPVVPYAILRRDV